MKKRYDSLYSSADEYWGSTPSALSLLALQHCRSGSLLDIGCGQGPDALFFARKGFRVTAMDVSAVGLAVLAKLKEDLPMTLLEQDMRVLPLGPFDVVFSRMALQMIPASERASYIDTLKKTYPAAVHVHIVPISGACFGDDFICAPDLLAEAYADWSILYSTDVWSVSRVPNDKGEPYLMHEAWIIARRA